MFEFSHSKEQKGFTLIELLVVISIIGVLSGLVMVTMQDMRAGARDARRRQDLAQVAKAVELYNLEYDSYVIKNSGHTGSGTGWFNYVDGATYTRSIAEALSVDGGKIPIVVDPTGATTCNPTVRYCYMFYRCGNGFFIYAKLEKPSAADIATCNADSCCPSSTSYGMNYAVGHR
ncbi:MAG: type II secretion system protein [Minisyncoccales bacterium]